VKNIKHHSFFFLFFSKSAKSSKEDKKHSDKKGNNYDIYLIWIPFAAVIISNEVTRVLTSLSQEQTHLPMGEKRLCNFIDFSK
jgi:hypothetical protein